MTSGGIRLRAAAGAGLVLFLTAQIGAAQSTGAQLTREQKPTYPEGLNKIKKQGNVVLVGRIDVHGKVQDIQPVAATNIGFVDPAVAAVQAWLFRPATRAGKPIDVAANIVLRFRLEGKTRGEIPRPIVGDLSVFPANAAGARSGPEGFPIHRGVDPRLRVDSVVDLSPSPKPQRLAVSAAAVSPAGRKIALYSGTVSVAANRSEAPVSFSAPVGSDWEDGIWKLEITVADGPAGGGQFWLAGDPARFDFAALAARNAEIAKSLPPVAARPGPTKPPGKPAARAKPRTSKA